MSLVKYLFIVINLFGIIGYQIFFPGGVTLKHELPSNVNPGAEYTVNITINKGDLNGFAKYVQELPNGFTAYIDEVTDATFSFKDQKVKFLWIALPPDEEFTITYKVKVDESIAGSFEMNGNFSYIFNNERQVAEVPKKVINVGESTAVVPKDIAQSSAPDEDIYAARTISPLSATTFKVEIKVAKENVKGFAKIQEQIPSDFTVEELNSLGGRFVMDENTLKIIWMVIPENDEFVISYKLIASPEAQGNQKIEGRFTYVMENTTEEYKIPSSTLFIESGVDDEPPVIIIADEGGTFKETEKEATVFASTEPEKEEPVVEEPVIEEPVVEEPVITSIPEPEADIQYRVQVAAGHKSVANDYFKKKFQLQDNILIENHEGWIKYTIGSYKVYKEGRDRRNSVWSKNKITDAFVTAYNAGNRITVQEALMITKQEWFK